jgi:hypothetical protein
MKAPKLEDEVIVYDRHRFEVPLRAVVVDLAKQNDGVQVRLLESNSVDHQIGCVVWVPRRQPRKSK